MVRYDSNPLEKNKSGRDDWIGGTRRHKGNGADRLDGSCGTNKLPLSGSSQNDDSAQDVNQKALDFDNRDYTSYSRTSWFNKYFFLYRAVL